MFLSFSSVNSSVSPTCQFPVHLPAGERHVVVIVLREQVVLHGVVAVLALHAVGAVALPGLVTGAFGRAAWNKVTGAIDT